MIMEAVGKMSLGLVLLCKWSVSLFEVYIMDKDKAEVEDVCI